MPLQCGHCDFTYDDSTSGKAKFRKHLNNAHKNITIEALNNGVVDVENQLQRCAKCQGLISMKGPAVTNHIKACVKNCNPAERNEFRYRDFFPGYTFGDNARANAFVIVRPVAILLPIPGPPVVPNENLGVIAPVPDPPAAAIVENEVANLNEVLPEANPQAQNVIAAGNPAIAGPIPIQNAVPRRRGRNAPRNQNVVVANAVQNNPVEDITRFGFDFDVEPSPDQLRELDNLASELSEGCYSMHPAHKRPFRSLVEKLLQIHLAIGGNPCLKKLAIYSLLILPGLYVRLQRVKTDRLGEVLRQLTESDSPVVAILIRARQTLQVYPRRPNRGPALLTKSKVDNLLEGQRIGALMNALEANADGLVVTTKTLARLEELTAEFHPVGDEAHDNVDDIDAPPDVAAASFDMMELAGAITKLPMGSAAGASGWTFHLLRSVYEGEARKVLAGVEVNEDSGLGLLKRFLSTITMGTVDPFVLRKLNTSRLSYIPKANNGGDRPLAIGDSILRLLLRVLNAKYATDVGKKLEPLQVAVGTSGGCEVMAAMAQQSFSHADATLTLDLHSAFNQVWRRAIAEGLHEHAPALLPIFKLLYGRPSELRSNAKEGRAMLVGLSSRGCKQGDPLSMLYFAVAIHSWLRSVNTLVTDSHAELAPAIVPFTIGFADDIALGGDPTVLSNCLPAITATLRDTTGLVVTQRKCKLLDPSMLYVLPEGDGPQFTVVHEGTILVGVPIGTEAYQRTESARLLFKAAKGARVLSASNLVSAQAKFTLLKMCVNARPQYLSRNLHPTLIHDILCTFDHAIDLCLQSILGVHLELTRAKLRGLPLSHGGCGLKRHGGSESIAAYNSRVQLVTNFLRLNQGEGAALRRAFDSISAFQPIDFIHNDIDNHPVSTLREEHSSLLTMVLNDLENEVDGDKKRAWVQSGVQLGNPDRSFTASGRFLLWSGGVDRRWLMGDSVFTSALRRRLCFHETNSQLMCPHTELHRPAGAHVDLAHSFGHLCLCHVGTPTAILHRHNYISNALKDLLKATIPGDGPIPANVLAVENVVGNRPNGDAIIADIVLNHQQIRTIIDVVIVEPFNRHGVGRVEAGSAVDAAEERKRIHYGAVATQPGTLFVPFALDSNGYVGKSATAYLVRLREANPAMGSRIKAFLQEVSHHLAKQTAIASEAGRAAAIQAMWN